MELPIVMSVVSTVHVYTAECMMRCTLYKHTYVPPQCCAFHYLLPYQPGLGQLLLLAVAQQHPHVR